MNSKQLLLTLGILIATAPIPGARASDQDKIPDEVVAGETGTMMHEFLRRLEAFDFHGSVLVARKGEILLHNAYGIADVKTGRRNTTNTLFSTGSVTKQFTATGIMRLVSEGKLSTDDSITEFFKGVPKDKEKITVHQLLSHSSGLESSYGDDSEEIQRDDLVRRVFSRPLMFDPGTEYEYSNAGYSLLAAIIEKITKERYEDYLRENLYLPNGMENTGLTSLSVHRDKVACSQNPSINYLSPSMRTEKNWNLIGNGGQLSTPSDMYRWLLALHRGSLVPKEARKRMFTRHVREGGNYHYGYGWSIFPSPWGGDVIWHNGGAMPPGWSCAVYQYLDDDAIFIVFSNKPMDGQHPVDEIVTRLAQILHGKKIPLPPALPSTKLDPALVSGTYRLSGGGSLTTQLREGRLQIIPAGQKAISRIFPSRMGRRLQKYNAKSQEMVELLADGNFAEAGELMDSPDGEKFVQGWWKSLGALGEFQEIEVHGTRVIEEAQTYCRLDFEKGKRDLVFYWMDGRCVGIGSGKPPEKVLYPLSPTHFVSYSLMSGDLIEANFEPKGTLTLSLHGSTVKGVIEQESESDS